MSDGGLVLVDVAGDARARGAAIGAACKARIEAALEFYAALFALAEADLAAAGARCAEAIGAFRADHALEIEACADAAGVPAYRLFAMNARSELMGAAGAPECTALSFTPEAILGQTWDWVDVFEDLFVLARHTLADGRRFLTLTEPGMLAKIGMNAAGVGVCLNFLMPSAPWRGGAPIHALLRAVLECASWDEAALLLSRHPPGAAGNVLIAGAEGRALNLEADTAANTLIVPEGGVFAHTNHALAQPQTVDDALIANSYGRLRAADLLAARRKRRDAAAMAKILCDAKAGPISCAYAPFRGLHVGSVAAIVMDLRAGLMRVRRGPSPEAPFHTFSV